MDSRLRARLTTLALAVGAVILVAAFAYSRGLSQLDRGAVSSSGSSPPAVALSPLASTIAVPTPVPTLAPTLAPTSVPAPISTLIPSPQPPLSLLPEATAATAPAATATAATAPAPVEPEAHTETPVYGYRVVAEYPHDPNAFTQGLHYVDGTLYEGTGLHGRSSLRRVEMETGEIVQVVPLPDSVFGEGIVVVDDRIVQLTWQSNVGFVFDRESLALQSQFTYPTEGWGITYDGEHLIMSDGSATLYRWDAETMAEVGRMEVTDQGVPVARLNELEIVNGEIWANIWQTDRIARIDPQTGNVVGWIDLTGLLPAEDRDGSEDVLNGIAYDAENDRLFVTGKLWPKLIEIELTPADSFAPAD